jgi:hypothetical protein
MEFSKQSVADALVFYTNEYLVRYSALSGRHSLFKVSLLIFFVISDTRSTTLLSESHGKHSGRKYQSILVTKLVANIELSFLGPALNARALGSTVGVAEEDAMVNTNISITSHTGSPKLSARHCRAVW